MESLFNKVAGLKACNFIKKRLQHRCFLVNIAKFLRIHYWQNTSRRLLLKTTTITSITQIKPCFVGKCLTWNILPVTALSENGYRWYFFLFLFLCIYHCTYLSMNLIIGWPFCWSTSSAFIFNESFDQLSSEIFTGGFMFIFISRWNNYKVKLTIHKLTYRVEV